LHLDNEITDLTGEPNAFHTLCTYALTDYDVPPKGFEQVKALIMPPDKPEVDRKKFEKEIDRLTAKIAKAKGNLALVDPEYIQSVQDTIKGLDQEKSRMQAELQESQPMNANDAHALICRVLTSLYEMAYCCRELSEGREVSKEHLRAFLNSTTHIVCNTEITGKKSRVRHAFVGGEIVFCGGEGKGLEPRLPG
jgi:hypothetical protein